MLQRWSEDLAGPQLRTKIGVIEVNTGSVKIKYFFCQTQLLTEKCQLLGKVGFT